MRGWKEWFDEQCFDPEEEEIVRELAQMSLEEEWAVREFNEGQPIPCADKEEPPRAWTKDELPF